MTGSRFQTNEPNFMLRWAFSEAMKYALVRSQRCVTVLLAPLLAVLSEVSSPRDVV